MIVVIADDFTGAAELAGIGLRYDLKVELATSVDINADADLFVVSTDSRSMSRTDALKVTAHTIQEVLKLKPQLVYKKIDSVFRGHVIDELQMQLKESGLKRTLVVGANPSLGRTITDGKYFINGDPISESDFGTDPEFAITDSLVLHMIRAGEKEARVLKHTDELPVNGIVMAEVESSNDVAIWANKADNTWLLAGAGDFFTALLHKQYKTGVKERTKAGSPHLYVSGTAYGRSREYIKRINDRLHCVAYMTTAMMQTGDINNETWYNSVGEMLSANKKAVIAINDDEVDPWNVSAFYLRMTMAGVVGKILEKNKVKEIFIEGGSTAAAILNELGIKKLSVVDELKRGVVRMKAKDLYITVKPGSYELPDEIKQLYFTN